MNSYFYYIVLDSDYFEDLQNYSKSKNNSNGFINLLKDKLNSSWNISSNGIWTYCMCANRYLPFQGWKIHISATLWNADKILQRVSNVCLKNKISFKFISDEFLLSLINSKSWYRGSSGKFITIYPRSIKEFDNLIEELNRELKGFKGPYILSDFRYKKSKVIFFRYGGFRNVREVNVFGEKKYFIYNSKGKKIVDKRGFYPIVPEQLELPCFLKKEFKKRSLKNNSSVKLNNRYIIKSAISHSNTGGVYKAIDTKENNIVIVKEARPFTNMNKYKLDSIFLLRRERYILYLLKNSGISPRPVDFFKEWENYYLVEEYIEGVPLNKYRAIDNIVVSNIHTLSKFQIMTFNIRWLKLALKIVKAVEKIHLNNIILGDLSPNNIIIDTKNDKIALIDFEGSFIKGSRKWLNLFTPGFASKNRLRNKKPKFSDDFYSLGSLLFSLLLPINPIFHFEKGKAKLFLDKFVSKGIILESISNLIMDFMKETDYENDFLSNERNKIEKIIYNLKKSKPKV